MKSFDQFVLEFMERREIDENNAHHLATLIHILDEGKKKKKRKHAEDEEGGAPEDRDWETNSSNDFI